MVTRADARRRGSRKKAGGQGRTLPGQPRTAAQPRAAIRRWSRRRACAARAWVCGRPIKRAGGPAGLAWGRRAARKGQAHLDRAGSRSRAPGGASPEGARAGPEPRPRPGRVDSSCAARHSNARLRPAVACGRVGKVSYCLPNILRSFDEFVDAIARLIDVLFWLKRQGAPC